MQVYKELKILTARPSIKDEKIISHYLYGHISCKIRYNVAQWCNEIIEILKKNPRPAPQSGEVTRFKRRKPEDGNWGSAGSLDEVFDYIRMLDAEGYPPAFVRIGNYKLEFSRAFRKVSAFYASVRIIKEKENEYMERYV